jgi:anti-anti-sigma factor
MSSTISDPPIHSRDSATIHVSNEAADIVSLYLAGEFDAFNAPEIIDHALRALAADKHLVLDLSDTTFIDASVIGALVTIQAAADDQGRRAVLQLGTAPIVERVVAITNIEELLPRTETRVDAIGRIRGLSAAA